MTLAAPVLSRRSIRQRERRAEKRAKVAYQTPRCMICGNELKRRSTWQGGGVNHNAKTCSRKCSYTRWNWFSRG